MYKNDVFDSRRVLYGRFVIQYLTGALPVFLYICSVLRNMMIGT